MPKWPLLSACLKTSSDGTLGMNGWSPDTCGRLVEVAGETLRPGGLELTEYLLGFGNLQAGSRILDAGCGMGATLRHLVQAGHPTAVGVDSSEAMIAAARNYSPEASLFCSPLERLPFGTGSFDGIICECVLSQTVVTTVLAEFQRVLRVNGTLLVSDLYRRSACRNPGADLVSDGQLATKEQTVTMLEQAGFTIEHWEDRTRDLQRLAIQLIMAPGSAGENLFGWREQWCFLNETETGIERKDVGYHLLVARKTA